MKKCRKCGMVKSEFEFTRRDVHTGWFEDSFAVCNKCTGVKRVEANDVRVCPYCGGVVKYQFIDFSK